MEAGAVSAFARPMIPDDLAGVDRLQREVYGPQFVEDLAVFGDKLQRFPEGCWTSVTGGTMVGYLFSHPAQFAAPPALNRLLTGTADRPDCYFIHDVVVAPSHRGAGVGTRLVSAALTVAVRRGYTRAALVSVQGSRPYWERHGFDVVEAPSGAVDAVRESYGASACYMSRTLVPA